MYMVWHLKSLLAFVSELIFHLLITNCEQERSESGLIIQPVVIHAMILQLYSHIKESEGKSSNVVFLGPHIAHGAMPPPRL